MFLCTTYAETDDTHDDHGDDVENGTFEPLTKAWTSVEIVMAISCALLSRRLSTLSEHSLETSLFRCRCIAATDRRSGVCVSGLSFSVEERHLDQLLQMREVRICFIRRLELPLVAAESDLEGGKKK